MSGKAVVRRPTQWCLSDGTLYRYSSTGPHPGCRQTAPGHARRDPAVAASCFWAQRARPGSWAPAVGSGKPQEAV